MPSAYLVVKLIHILSATLLFGTGLGTAYFMLRAHLSGNVEAIKVTSRHVVIAYWLFMLPATIVQLATGLWLTRFLGIDWSSSWFSSVMTLFVVVAACWVPVVCIQVRISRITANEAATVLTPEYRGLMRFWIALGVPAFVLTIALFGLMVLKPGVG